MDISNVPFETVLPTVGFVAEITHNSARAFSVHFSFLREGLHFVCVVDEVHHDCPLGARPGHGRGSRGGSNDVGSRGGYLPGLPPARWRRKSGHFLYLYPVFFLILHWSLKENQYHNVNNSHLLPVRLTPAEWRQKGLQGILSAPPVFSAAWGPPLFAAQRWLYQTGPAPSTLVSVSPIADFLIE